MTGHILACALFCNSGSPDGLNSGGQLLADFLTGFIVFCAVIGAIRYIVTQGRKAGRR